MSRQRHQIGIAIADDQSLSIMVSVLVIGGGVTVLYSVG